MKKIGLSGFSPAANRSAASRIPKTGKATQSPSLNQAGTPSPGCSLASQVSLAFPLAFLSHIAFSLSPMERAKKQRTDYGQKYAQIDPKCLDPSKFFHQVSEKISNKFR
ncbi:MAG: hypothetical protein LBU69_06925 [Deltaproteobacteria bacterium]|jgi:hypothetical protein|nr:hypothetical protein [Deltaproteobacteria bacterium]